MEDFSHDCAIYSYKAWSWVTVIHDLTHWGRVTHICVSRLTIIGSDNGLSPGRRQAIIWTNAGLLLIRPLGTNFSEFLVKILIVSFKKMRLKESSAKRQPFCLGLNELNVWRLWYTVRTINKSKSVNLSHSEKMPCQYSISSWGNWWAIMGF